MHVFTATTDLTANVKRIIGFHVAETAGAAAVVRFRNGSVTGDIFAEARVPAVTGGNSIHFAAHRPINFPRGLYIQVVSGTVQGSVQPG